jgi:hypothetical protein
MITITISDAAADELRRALGVSPTPAPSPTPSPDPIPYGVRVINLPWGATGSGNVRIDTRNNGGFHGETLAVKFTTPNAVSPAFAKISGIESNAAMSVFRTACLSETPGDLDHPVGRARSVGVGFSFTYGVGTTSLNYANLKPGTTYYVNIKNQDAHGNPTCVGQSCDMFIELAHPSGL